METKKKTHENDHTTTVTEQDRDVNQYQLAELC